MFIKIQYFIYICGSNEICNEIPLEIKAAWFVCIQNIVEGTGNKDTISVFYILIFQPNIIY